MYNIKLDKDKYFITYAVVGGVEGGINIPSLPPDMSKANFYQWITKPVPKSEEVPDIDETTGLQKVNDSGELLTKTVINYYDVTDWYLNNEKYQDFLNLQYELLKESKKKEINDICQETIFTGIDIALDKSKPDALSHFSFTLEDQTNIKALYDKLKSENLLEVPYHADGEYCRIFTAEEMGIIYSSLESFKVYNVTLCNFIKQYIDSLETESEIKSITYSIDVLTSDLKSRFYELLSVVA